MIKKKNIYIVTFLLIIFIVVKNWTFLEKKYNYMIYKENCIISYKNLNDKNKPEALEFCDCKVKYLQKFNVDIFVSKLKVKEEFLKEESDFNSLCKKQIIK